MRHQSAFRMAMLAFACLLITNAHLAFAWIDTGHKVIAFIAWDDLTPTTRTAIISILKQHPRYDKDLLGTADPDSEKSDRHVFAAASTWPDLIRLPGNPMHATYSHPSWHFIDLPYAVNGQPVPDPKPATDPGPHNIVEALAHSISQLKASDTTPADRAIALCWVLHLVGDIHQPLHCTSMFSVQFPQGDKGGNSLMVLRDPPYADSRANLHLIWDELPGQFRSEALDGYEATGLRNDARFSRSQLQERLQTTDFMIWAKESHDLAVTYAYLNGTLEGATSSHEAGASHGPVPGLPPGYLANAEKITMQQLTLAGYRLADLLNLQIGTSK